MPRGLATRPASAGAAPRPAAVAPSSASRRRARPQRSAPSAGSAAPTDLPAIAQLVFLYAEADGPCSLCGRRRHRIAACGYEVRTGSRQRRYTGIELCPGCLERAGTQAVVRAVRRIRQQMTAPVGADGLPQRRSDQEDATAWTADLIRLAESGACRLPPPLPRAWLAPGR